MTWEPIDTAPQDGTRILLYEVTMDVVVSGHWHVDPGIDTPDAYEPAWSWWVADNDVILWDGGPDDMPRYWAPIGDLPHA
jgi:hypothetical protein